MHSVCELYSFRRAASAVGMADGEIDELVEFLAKKPSGGDEMADRRVSQVADRGARQGKERRI